MFNVILILNTTMLLNIFL